MVVYNWFVHQVSCDRTHLIYLLYFFLHQLTPLHLAAETGRIKILNYLLEQGADINIQDYHGVITRICAYTYQCW